MTTQLFDLSHSVFDGLVTYKGLPAPIICDYLSREASREHYADGTAFHIGRIDLIANTGTYIDAPFHRFADGKDLAQLDLAQVAHLDAIVVRVPQEQRVIDQDMFAGLNVRGKAVLVQTGWSRHWNTEEYFEGHSFLTRESAEFLRDNGAALVGIDSYNIDDTADGTRPVHTILLSADIPIVEHMRGLEQLPASGFKFYAVPVKVEKFGTFPVRAFAVVE